jgi:transcriptional regulator with XRE-family HTH domain
MIVNVDNREMREYVRRYMKEKGITQQMLAERLGISQAAVSQVLKGKSAVPESFINLLTALGLELKVGPKE